MSLQAALAQISGAQDKIATNVPILQQAASTIEETSVSIHKALAKAIADEVSRHADVLVTENNLHYSNVKSIMDAMQQGLEEHGQSIFNLMADVKGVLDDVAGTVDLGAPK